MATLHRRRRVVPPFGVPMDIYDIRCAQEVIGRGFIEVSDPDERGRRIHQASAERYIQHGYRYTAKALIRTRRFPSMKLALAYLRQATAKLLCR